LKVKLYVKSEKKVAGVDDRSHWGYVIETRMQGYTWAPPVGMKPDYKVYRETKYAHVLSEAQKKVIETVQKAALKYGFELEIVDAAKVRFLDRSSRRIIGQIKTFPALVTERGEIIKEPITEKKIKPLIAD